MRTLCIDIGGTGIKGIILDVGGNPLSEHARVATPQPAVPETVLSVIEEIALAQGAFDRVSVGFPGVVMDNVTRTAPHLDNASWVGFKLGEALEHRLQKPVRVANDAGIQGYGVIEGRGLEMVLTLGTGLGCGLYIDGHYVPNLELGHHPFGKRKLAYEDLVGDAVRKRVGKKRWNKQVRQVIAQLEPIFNYRKLYLGGGNSRRVDVKKLPANVVVVDNLAGLIGGLKLWA